MRLALPRQDARCFHREKCLGIFLRPDLSARSPLGEGGTQSSDRAWIMPNKRTLVKAFIPNYMVDKAGNEFL